MVEGNDCFQQWLKEKLDELQQDVVNAHHHALLSSTDLGLDALVPMEREEFKACAWERQGSPLLEDTVADHKMPNKQPAEALVDSPKVISCEHVKLTFNDYPNSKGDCSSFQKNGTSSMLSFMDSSVRRHVTPGASTILNSTDSSLRRACPGSRSSPTNADSEMLRVSQHSSYESMKTRIVPTASHRLFPDLLLRDGWLPVDPEESRNLPSARKNRWGKKLSETLNEMKLKKSFVPFGLATLASDSSESLRSGGIASMMNTLLGCPSLARCTIDPYSRTWMTWEFSGFLLLIFDVIYIPMQVFDIQPNSFLRAAHWLSIIYWTLTFFLTFLVSYQPKSESTLVKDRKAIALHYFKGWFALDMLLLVIDWTHAAIELRVNSDNSVGNVRMLRMVRLGRLSRSVRLLRVMRIGEVLQHVQALVDSEYRGIYFMLACNVAGIIFLAHLTACLWFGVGSTNASTSWVQEANLMMETVDEQYTHALAWAVSTLLGTDIGSAEPKSKRERICALAVVVCGTLTVSFVFSNTTAAMTRLRELKSAERDATFKLKRYLRENRISVTLSAKVIRYVEIAKRVHSNPLSSDKVVLLSLLSGPLKLELQLELHARHLISHSFFSSYHQCNPIALGELCLTALAFSFLSREDLLFDQFSQAHYMYFLVRGVMVYRRAKGAKGTRATAKIDRNNSFCESALWVFWIHRGRMTALIESQVLSLHAQSFYDVTEAHPDVFFRACDYARQYVRQVNECMFEDIYVWDVPSVFMYPEKYLGDLAIAEQRGPGGRFCSVSKAEQVDAELLDVESDSDSDDEQMLMSMLNHKSSGYLLSNHSNSSCAANSEKP